MTGGAKQTVEATQVKWRRLAGIGLAVTVVAGITLQLPPVRSQLALWEHRHAKFGYDPASMGNGFGFAKRSQLHNPEWGPWLLRDPAVVERRIGCLLAAQRDHLIVHRGEWALMFAALRLQGRSTSDIAKRPDGSWLMLGTLASEADPPRWWAQADWLRKETKATPEGSFRMGLLRPADTELLLSQLKQLKLDQLLALVHCQLRHDDGFSPAQRQEILQSWQANQKQYYSVNSAKSVDQMMKIRAHLIEEFSILGANGQLQYALKFPEGFTSRQREVCQTVVADFVRSCGWRPQVTDQAQLCLSLALEERTFDEVAADYFQVYKTRQRVAVGTRYSRKYGSGTTVYEDREVQTKERKSQVGQNEVVSLVIHWNRAGESVGEALFAPPYGSVTGETLKEMCEIVRKPQLQERELQSLDWYLANNAAAPWRYGLNGYERDWNVEDRMQ